MPLAPLANPWQRVEVKEALEASLCLHLFTFCGHAISAIPTPATPATLANYIKGAATVFIAGVVALHCQQKWTAVNEVFSSRDAEVLRESIKTTADIITETTITSELQRVIAQSS